MQLQLKQVIQALWCALLSVALYFSGFFVLFTPLPLLYLSLRRNKIQWALGFVFTLLFALSFYKFLIPVLVAPEEISHFSGLGLLNFYYYMLVGLLLGIGVWKRWSFGRWGAYVGVLTTAIVLLVAFLCQYFGVYDVRGFLQQVVVESQGMLDQITASPTVHGDKAEVIAVAAQMKKNLEYLPRLLPSLIFSFTLFVMIFNLSFLRATYRISKYLVKAGDFRRLQISSFCVWVIIVAATCYFLDYYVFHISWLTWVALNLLIVGAVAYFIQGISIMAFFLKRYSPLFRFGIYGLVILFFQMVGLVVVGLGLADTWFDFRKLHKQTSKK